MAIPAIDIFAGPGGLGEGFSSIIEDNKRVFKTVLSIEKEEYAHQTLTLRSFFRQFEPGEVPLEYYDYVKGELTLEELHSTYPKQEQNAKKEAWQVTLGYKKESVSPKKVDKRISKALKGEKNWVLLGGPPCQAYSIVGRSRNRKTILDAKEDERVDLYKQYLRILAVHNPAVFIMENVKGILSAKSTESPVFKKILNDLKDPVKYSTDISEKEKKGLTCPGYRIFSLVKAPDEYDLEGSPILKAKDFIIRCEEYGIPQARHRVILLGIRKDLDVTPGILEKGEKEISIADVIGDLPRLRSGLSRKENTYENWHQNLAKFASNGALAEVDSSVTKKIISTVSRLTNIQNGVGNDFVRFHSNSKIRPYESEWFLDSNLNGVSNHVSKSHMNSDLHRYLFVSTFALAHNRSPKLSDFPKKLLPNHKNVDEALKNKKFADRFRVQMSGEPSKTITSHISKDGHYYIHYDPSQCRSLTVREAARIQTFPDNYHFCGPRTAQYIQVGNAVPPLLAKKIAGIVREIMGKIINAETA